MKFGVSLVIATLGFAVTLFQGAAAVATGSDIDIAEIVKALEARDVPADIIKAVNYKLMARTDPMATVTVTTCEVPCVPATPAPPASTPVESAPAPPPATTEVPPPSPTTPVETPPATTPATPPPTEGQPPASSAPAPPPATETPVPAPVPPSSEGGIGSAPSTTTVPATSTISTTEIQTSTEATSTETSFAAPTTPSPSAAAPTTPPAPVNPNAAGMVKMNVVAVGVAVVAALY